MRIILLWLAMLAIVFGVFKFQQERKMTPENLVQPQAAQDRSAVAGADGLAYINFLRTQAGLNQLAYSPELEKAAENHAQYLTEHHDEGHDERDTASPLFTGVKPADRAAHAGYLYKGVHENVSTSNRHRDVDQSEDFYTRQQIDGLMTAIYHRFSLLEQNINEAGVTLADNGQYTAVVVNQGNSRFNRLCAVGRLKAEPGRPYYKDVCFNGAVVYEAEAYNPSARAYVVYPVGNTALPDFHSERPDPVPDYDVTGNPVSIAFAKEADKVQMRSFKLYQGDTEISPVRVLTQANDPNHELNERQFALFPLQPLEYDTAYRAVFDYVQSGKTQQAEWTFRTKKPDCPYFLVNGGERLALTAGDEYFIHWQNRWCLTDCPKLVYQQRGGAKLEVLARSAGGVVVRVNGTHGGDVRLMFENDEKSAVMLYLTEAAAE
ncbi:CAP domain-containing protein [Neisseria perflava]|uniref:CAP domain-containing protein n=1 Tax=Neisseria perflava TaxID=33053 RepID=UPI00209CAACA|nr:CAP domain-containing protein [Neisseria perflava]MCP1660423.1 uncharacterized protein YkwD [Neisseria perflava]MCP1772105.1 uncharacterized protein YkwD [Neisseria perflava]